jgi:hypothetical protein
MAASFAVVACQRVYMPQYIYYNFFVFLNLYKIHPLLIQKLKRHNVIPTVTTARVKQINCATKLNKFTEFKAKYSCFCHECYVSLPHLATH